MKERKYIRFRVDMYEDTKFKIIDRMEERDLIHYIWTRIVTLAGKVNLEGDLYMSKNMPYTIETLAIEFNRDTDQIKLALDTFVKLNMLEFTEDKVYSVINFSKHQNIKVKEKIMSENKKEEIKKCEESNIENIKSVVNNERVGDLRKEERNRTINQLAIEDSKDNENKNLQIDNKENSKILNDDVIKSGTNTSEVKNNGGILSNMPIPLYTKKNRKINKDKKKSTTSEISDEGEEDKEVMCWFTDGEMTLAEGESIIGEWTF